MDGNGVILVVDSGTEHYRGSLLASAARRNPLWLLHHEEPTWQSPHVVATTVVDLLDPSYGVPDSAALVAAAAEIAAEHNVVGVFTYNEFNVAVTARIAEALGLPGLTVEAAENCRDKYRTRTALTAAGIPQPRFARVTDPESARDAAAGFGYPVVLKPRGLGASIGVVRVDDAERLADAVPAAEMWSGLFDRSYTDGFLVEEMLDGPEISIDGAVYDGEYRPFIIAHKLVGIDPYFVELGHRVSADDPLYADPALLSMLADAHRALGVRHGITHTEVKLTSRGPVIVEVNGRLGGDLIQHLNHVATGVDAADVLVDLAVGVRPRITPTRRASVGIRFSYPPADGVLRSVDLPTPEEVPGLLSAAALAEPGSWVRLPPARYIARCAYVICEGDDPDRCDSALDAAAARVTVTLEPTMEPASATAP